MKPELGQKLFSLNVENLAQTRGQVLTPCIVTKVGRKYFTVRKIDDDTGWSDQQYYIDGWREKCNYSATSKLYQSEQAWEDEKEKSYLAHEIYKAFENGRNSLGLPLDSLQEINAIISRQ